MLAPCDINLDAAAQDDDVSQQIRNLTKAQPLGHAQFQVKLREAVQVGNKAADVGHLLNFEAQCQAKYEMGYIEKHVLDRTLANTVSAANAVEASLGTAAKFLAKHDLQIIQTNITKRMIARVSGEGQAHLGKLVRLIQNSSA